MPAPRTRIDNATCVLPDGTRPASVLLGGGKILDIDPAPSAHADETIDAGGLHLIPGVIDSHVHFREPGLTHKENLHTATLACAAGGVTTFIEMPNTQPPATTQAAIDHKLKPVSYTHLELSEQAYRFVHVDVDLHEPTMDSLAYFYPRLSPGGVMVIDDYGPWPNGDFPGCKVAVDAFAQRHGLPIAVLDTGNAVIFKR